MIINCIPFETACGPGEIGVQRVVQPAPRSSAECFNMGGSNWVGHMKAPVIQTEDFILPDETEAWAICAWINQDGHVWRISWDHKPFTADELKEPGK